jgi:elongation factor G
MNTPDTSMTPERGRPRVVAVVGTPESGRSTLASALADLLPIMQFDVALPGENLDMDILLLVASAQLGLDGAMGDVWERAAERAIPRIMAITHLDVGRVDDDEMRLIAERVLGEEALALTLPLADDDEEMAGTLMLTTMIIHDEVAGISREADAEHRDIAGATRDKLVEAVLANTEDEALLAQALIGLEPSPSRLDEEVHVLLAKGIMAGSFPVVTVPNGHRPPVGIRDLARTLERIGSQVIRQQ